MIGIPDKLQAVSAPYIPAFIIKRPSIKYQVEGVKQRSLLRSRKKIFTNIDLSMSSNPIEILDALLNDQEATHKISQLDLSYSYIHPQEVKLLIHRLIGFPKLRTVLVSGYEPWNTDFNLAIKQGARYRLLERLDNKYPSELPAFPGWLARLLRQYDQMPARELYKPQKIIPASDLPSQHWTNDISVSGLPPDLLTAYHSSLATFLSSLHLELTSTASDNACFYHAVADQLGMPHQVLIQSLTNQILHNQQAIQQLFPALAGEQFSTLLGEMQDSAWAEPRILQVISFLLNKRAILFYYDRVTGELQILVFMPDGTVLQHIPDNYIDSNDLIVVHNGQHHFLGGMLNQANPNLLTHNQALLDGTTFQQGMAVPENTDSSLPVMVFLFIASWNSKFRN